MRTNVKITEGPISKNFLLYTLPIIFTGILQQLYSAADIIVVGRFAGSNSMAAVGATSSITNLFINLFISFASGTSVLVAQNIGAGDKKAVEKAVHTSISVSFIFGVFLMFIGLFLSRHALNLMDVPKNILGEATLYMQIIFVGMPANFIYNFGAAILRSSGDTSSPLIFLSVSGLLNVILNLIFVIFFGFGADGVGLATIISQYISAFLVILKLTKSNNYVKLQLKKLKIHLKTFKLLMRYGVPAGIQSTMFSFSNVQIQGAVNSFGEHAIAGSAAAVNIEALVYVIMNSFHHSMLTFTGQNLGAKKPDRIKKTVVIGTIQVLSISVLSSVVVLLFARQLVGLYAPGNDIVIDFAVKRMYIVLPLYCMCGLMDSFVGASRGLGASISTTIISLVCLIFGRLGWLYTVFEYYKTWESIFMAFTVSWLIAAFVQFLMCMYMMRKRINEMNEIPFQKEIGYDR